MPINGSDLLNEPWNTTWSPFTDLFDKFLDGAGNLFFLLPVSFIAIALYVKTRDPVITSMFMVVTGILASAGGIFVGAPEISNAFVIFAAIGIVSLFVGIFFRR